MPLVRIGSKLVYYAHVPKCAGSAVEHYLRQNFGPIAFCDTKFLSHPPATKWTKSSPQHVDAMSMGRLFPPKFIDARFATVRHPVKRLVSVYRFQRDVEKTIPEATSFAAWIDTLAEARQADPYIYDNHVRPMTEIVPRGARTFKLEQGLGPLVDWLQKLAGEDYQLPGEIEPRNVLSDRLEKDGLTSKAVRPAKAVREKIYKLYRQDFDRFGYKIDL
ncbi:sulfotransferase family protein [Parvularcula flava]|uniref:Sulfotransferase family protein n=2 Tax=Aquisalinus luteolus TaxID=1566827 RepID=A0A8J3ES77_9PROT|nr:sulfotransferase family 2 domain-containing protein [Aquisalinus luteolus]NHK29522.1 sulfotransferase family protein [Aquisalinus luteolus]GGI01685.1 hypothetical protein GCM10011355_32920 [Aquisalinus luteolus]